METWLQAAWDEGEAGRAARREQQRLKKRYGMQVTGTSVRVLATLIPKPKKRRKKRGKIR